MLKNGQIKRFLIYTLGEIFLVVVGILIALQIDNWNIQRKNRIREVAILKQLHADFQSNKVQLDSIKYFNQLAIDYCDIIISLMPFEKDYVASMDTINQLAPKVWNTKTFNPTNGSIEALINSSSFEIIQNDTLRNLLVKWKDVYSDYSEEEQATRNFVLNEVSPYFREEFDYLNVMAPSNRKMMSSKKFRNLWFDIKGYRQQIIQSMKEEKVAWHIDEIIRLTKPNAPNTQ